MVVKNDAYYHVDEQLAEYPVLNMDETMREWVSYDRPEGSQLSKPFDGWLEANQYIQYLENLNRDPSYMVVVYGYYIEDEDYLKVVYKTRVSYT